MCFFYANGKPIYKFMIYFFTIKEYIIYMSYVIFIFITDLSDSR